MRHIHPSIPPSTYFIIVIILWYMSRLLCHPTPPYQLIHANAAYGNLSGFDCHHVIGKPVSNFVSLHQSPSNQQQHQALQNATMSQSQNNGNPIDVILSSVQFQGGVYECNVSCNIEDDSNKKRSSADTQMRDKDVSNIGMHCLMSISPVVSSIPKSAILSLYRSFPSPTLPTIPTSGVVQPAGPSLMTANNSDVTQERYDCTSQASISAVKEGINNQVQDLNEHSQKHQKSDNQSQTTPSHLYHKRRRSQSSHHSSKKHSGNHNHSIDPSSGSSPMMMDRSEVTHFVIELETYNHHHHYQQQHQHNNTTHRKTISHHHHYHHAVGNNNRPSSAQSSSFLPHTNQNHTLISNVHAHAETTSTKSNEDTQVLQRDGSQDQEVDNNTSAENVDADSESGADGEDPPMSHVSTIG